VIGLDADREHRRGVGKKRKYLLLPFGHVVHGPQPISAFWPKV
jgi:hypothetical protein